MTGKTVRAAHEHPQADGPAPFTTLVELTFQKKKVERWIRFGRKSYEQIVDRRRSVVGFTPDSDPPSVWWTPMLAFRSWRGVSDECSTPCVSGIVQAGGR